MFNKEIKYLYFLNRNNLDLAERQIEKILSKIYEKGKKAGKKEERRQTLIFAKRK